MKLLLVLACETLCGGAAAEERTPQKTLLGSNLLPCEDLKAVIDKGPGKDAAEHKRALAQYKTQRCERPSPKPMDSREDARACASVDKKLAVAPAKHMKRELLLQKRAAMKCPGQPPAPQP